MRNYKIMLTRSDGKPEIVVNYRERMGTYYTLLRTNIPTHLQEIAMNNKQIFIDKPIKKLEIKVSED